MITTDKVHIDIGGATAETQHTLIVDNTATPEQLREGAQIAEHWSRPVAACLLRQAASWRSGTPIQTGGHYGKAQRWIGEVVRRARADDRTSEECLMTATAHALLAVADAISGTSCPYCMTAAHDRGLCPGPEGQ